VRELLIFPGHRVAEGVLSSLQQHDARSRLPAGSGKNYLALAVAGHCSARAGDKIGLWVTRSQTSSTMREHERRGQDMAWT